MGSRRVLGSAEVTETTIRYFGCAATIAALLIAGAPSARGAGA
jgi:hypothetical protein